VKENVDFKMPSYHFTACHVYLVKQWCYFRVDKDHIWSVESGECVTTVNLMLCGGSLLHWHSAVEMSCWQLVSDGRWSLAYPSLNVRWCCSCCSYCRIVVAPYSAEQNTEFIEGSM